MGRAAWNPSTQPLLLLFCGSDFKHVPPKAFKCFYLWKLHEGRPISVSSVRWCISEPDMEQCLLCVWWMNEWMNEWNRSSGTWLLSEVRPAWRLAPPFQSSPWPAWDWAEKWFFIHVALIITSSLRAKLSDHPEDLFNVMKGDLMELRRAKQKADSRFRKVGQAVPPRGRRKKKKRGKGKKIQHLLPEDARIRRRFGQPHKKAKMKAR